MEVIDAIVAFAAAYQAWIGIVVLVGMLIAFATERLPPATIAVVGAAVMVVLGLISPDRLMEVFSNPAPITIGAMFILSGALLRTGAIDALAAFVLKRATRRPRLASAEIFGGAFLSSAIINNTPVVMVLIPVVRQLASLLGIAATRLLMPLSYICILGGSMTLIGTSTNLLVDGVGQRMGQAPFGMFEITTVGIVAATAGTLTLLILGPWLLPDRASADGFVEEEDGFLTELTVLEGSAAIGSTIAAAPSLHGRGVRVLGLKRGGDLEREGLEEIALAARDRIVAAVSAAELMSMVAGRNFSVGISSTAGGVNLIGENAPADIRIVEAAVAPTHPSIGQRMVEIPFLSRHPMRLLGVSRARHLPGPDLPNMRIRPADRLLIAATSDNVRRLRENVHLMGIGESGARAFRRGRAPIAIGVLLAIIALATANIMPIAVLAIVGVGVILLTRCIDAEEAWNAIDGNVLALIFAMLAVGVGLQSAGTVTLIVEAATPWLTEASPLMLLIGIYALTSFLTEIVTNNAVAVLMAPLVIGLADQLGVDARPLLIAVMFAASASFATPIGYQTNTLVYSAANYRFADFLKVGIPMNIIVGLATCVAISAL